ncbi:Abi family protein [Psychrobacter sp. FDAARGOS_221]|uniref:Abi family protein n=1 Tax=Psychrobacter sp. FDAARGOS_221 TaxID=1975705 RepID=UPI000BB548DF|nr:Abi family protein [Psychrobacter sp. FDAARGOS_221]PNK59661.1 abortive phage resistance protein [Psychrobacter sp. FDAARGOS_221]
MNLLNKQSCKPWQSFEKQIALLENRGMIFEDKTDAIHILSQVNYYRLSGYWYPFRQLINNTRENNFYKDTKFTDVLNIYNFDKKLRMLCLEALEVIEMSVRTNIAYNFGRISPVAHLDKNNFDQKFVQGESKQINYESWLKKYKYQIRRSNKSPFIKHHIATYEDLPIWVGVEVMDFGSLSVLYSGLKGRQKKQISQSYGVDNPNVFGSWLKSLNYIRNICAHHARLWNINIDVVAKVDSRFLGLSSADNKRLFFYLIMMKHLLAVIEPNSTWDRKVEDLFHKFPTPTNKAIKLNDIGFSTWQDW